MTQSRHWSTTAFRTPPEVAFGDLVELGCRATNNQVNVHPMFMCYQV